MIEIKIGEKSYKLHYPMNCVAAAEKELSSKNILTMVQQAEIKHVPPSLSDMYVLFKYALAGGNPEIKEDEAEQLYISAINEYSIPEVLGTVILALTETGVLGIKGNSAKMDILHNGLKDVSGVKE
ncbi:MAG: hypothetical protein IJ181_04315 [Acidaminococcaceae bacterium]|nr:hypothetical protein [Acidaminococcaceae bacterium]